MPQLTWLVTGCSSGIGEQLVYNLLSRGEQVIATGRKGRGRLQHLKDAGATVMNLDVTASQEELNAIAEEAITIYGGIDVLANNAAYIEAAVVEEATHERLLGEFSTNLFGAMAVTRSVLPHFRARKSGVLAFIGSVGSWQGDPGAGPYCGTKFAMEGMVECLQQEIPPFGIKAIIFEPGYYRTKVMSPENIKFAPPLIPEYTPVTSAIKGFVEATNGSQPGDPRKLADRIIDVVKLEGMAAGREMPLRLPIGLDSAATIGKNCEATIKLLDDWEDLIYSTDLDTDT